MSARSKPRKPHKSRDRRASTDPVSINNRSRITNGTRLGVDLRTSTGRRWRDIFADAMRRTRGSHEQLCRSLATLTIEHEALDAAVVGGRDIDPLHLIRLAGAIKRTLDRLDLVAPAEPVADDAPAWLVGPQLRPEGRAP